MYVNICSKMAFSCSLCGFVQLEMENIGKQYVTLGGIGDVKQRSWPLSQISELGFDHAFHLISPSLDQSDYYLHPFTSQINSRVFPVNFWYKLQTNL